LCKKTTINQYDKKYFFKSLSEPTVAFRIAAYANNTTRNQTKNIPTVAFKIGVCGKIKKQREIR
jgi:hypothetical protein